jgi:hypothetical protein
VAHRPGRRDLQRPDGNKSAVLDNNNHGFPQASPINDGPTNATMGFNWTTDPTSFTEGFIQYDFYLEPAPADGLTYVDHRFGYRTDGVNFINTLPTETVGWYSLRVNGDQTASIQANGITGVGAASVAPLVGAVNTLKIGITPGFLTYTLNGTLVEWETPIGALATLPWFPGATGVSGMTWVGDFQGAPGAPHGLVFIDNILVSPVPEPTGVALWACAGAVAALRRRRS